MINDRDRKKASSKADDLLERIRQTQQSAEETLKTTKETMEQLSYAGRVFQKIGSGISWANEKVVEPVLGCLPFTKGLWRATINQYNWFCHPAESFPKAIWRGTQNAVGKTANRIANLFRKEKIPFDPDVLPLGEFSRTRAGIAVLVTALAGSPILNKMPVVGEFVPEMVSDTAVALIYEPPYDATRMGLEALFNGGSLPKETIYLNGKNEIVPAEDVWSAGGCEKAPECAPDDAVTFHIKPSLMHHAWSLATGRGLFLPDYVAVPIPNVPAKCDVISYGLRWRISKWMNSYPVLLEARCESLPVNMPTNPAQNTIPAMQPALAPAFN